MNYKDLKSIAVSFKKELETKFQLKKMFFERNSRPRVKRDILRETDNTETSNCVTNDCTHDWGGK